MKEEINIRRTIEKTRSVAESRQRAMKAQRPVAARRRDHRLNRHNSTESLLVEMLPLVKRIALKIRGHLLPN